MREMRNAESKTMIAFSIYPDLLLVFLNLPLIFVSDVPELFCIKDDLLE